MEKKYVLSVNDATTGDLPGGTGTFRVLIDKDSSGAKYFSLLVNTMWAGEKGVEHKHEVEHCWYILSGTGTIYIEGKSLKIAPKMAVYAPANVLHKIDVGPDEDLTYVLIYAPPGPEQLLKQMGEHAFASK